MNSDKIVLPDEYILRMKELLEDEYEDFLRSMYAQPYKALRLNPLKAEEAQLLVLLNKSFGYPEQVPWEPLGYYFGIDDNMSSGTGSDSGDGRGINETDSQDGEGSLEVSVEIPPGKNPLHEAGLYYIQEPSAMLPVTLLMDEEYRKDAAAEKGERILDLCAAPGGKTTQIASYMRGRGILVCNEIVPQRAGVLSGNVERMGVRNALVLNETPQKLRDTFFDYFDRILVDAPCSGEGMFRKNQQAAEEWSTDNVRMCAGRQDEILDCAASMLKPGGIMVYSTCTFSREEDEECIERFLERHRDYKLIGQQKLFPHRVRGEGHFAAKLVRMAAGTTVNTENSGNTGIIAETTGYCACGYCNGADIKDYLGDGGRKGRRDGKEAGAKRRVFSEFCMDVLSKKGADDLSGRLLWFGDTLYLVPEGAPGTDGLKVLRAGLQLGTFRKDRFEPSHALALAMRPGEAARMVNITLSEASDYISGMTLNCGQDDMRGWVLVCCEGISLGWGKAVGNVIKNHYPKGLRKQL